MIKKNQIDALEKLVNSDLVKSVYPMIENIEVKFIEDLNTIVLRIHINDSEMNSVNMYSRGLDPHYLTDHHFYNFFPYLSVPRDIKIGHVVFGPTGDVVSRYIS